MCCGWVFCDRDRAGERREPKGRKGTEREIERERERKGKKEEKNST
jgi:hypothetical protein